MTTFLIVLAVLLVIVLSFELFFLKTVKGRKLLRKLREKWKWRRTLFLREQKDREDKKQ